MTFMQSTRRYVSLMLTAVVMLTSLASIHAQAAASMIGTHEVLAEQQYQVDREALKAMLADQAVQEKMASMGVSPDQVEKRIDSLTPQELAHFNAQLEEGPAGAGVVGVIVLFLLVFVVTDILCVTNIYRFVNCAR